MKYNRLLLVAAVAFMINVNSFTARADEKQDLTVVTAGTAKLSVPKSWKSIKPSSSFRKAQFQITNPKNDEETADVVVFHFGGNTGGIKANVDRWISQFAEKGRKEKTTQGKSAQGEYIICDVTGTWNKPDGPPFARKTIAVPGSRVINVILIVKNDYYFIKLSGPEALVSSQAEALRTAIGGDAKTEKPYKS